MATDEEILEHYNLSLKYLQTSGLSFESTLIEPSLFNCIHALELGVKAVLLTVTDGPLTTHNVGGQLGRYFRESYGEETCRRVKRILI